MWNTPDWTKLTDAEVRAYRSLALDLGTGLGIARKPYVTGNIAEFFDKYDTSNASDWTGTDTERVGSADARQITWKDGRGAERVAHVRGVLRNITFTRTIDVNTAAFFFNPKQINMSEYRARAAKKRALDVKLHGYVPGFRPMEESPFGPAETRFRTFNPRSPFEDQDRHGFVQFHVYR